MQYLLFNCLFVIHCSSVNDVFVEPESREDDEKDDPADTEGQTSRLWVDRFSPRHYTELLSDDVRTVSVSIISVLNKSQFFY